MSAPEILDALVALVSAVPGAGHVYGYERYAARKADFRALYTGGDGQVRGWFVSRAAVRHARTGSGRYLVTTTWHITGFVGLVDADESEIVTNGLVDAICAGFLADPSLGGMARGIPIDGDAGVSVSIDKVMFADVLCHRAQIEVITQHYEAGAGGSLADFAPAHAWLITAIVADLRADTAIAAAATSIEGAVIFDPDDDPGGIALTVTPLTLRAAGGATNIGLRDRVGISIGVIIAAPSSFEDGAGAAAADGLDALDRLIRARLHGWGDGLSTVDGEAIDEPFVAAGGDFIRAAPGRIAWRATYRGALIVEV